MVAGPLSAASGPEYRRIERSFWAFQQPSTTPKPPTVGSDFATWVKSPVDAFVAAKLAEAGLHPAPEADRATLIRRAYFNVTGLPPSPAEVADFLSDRAPNAWEKVVDRLLESPHYGERWGQHWLDVVRFAETEGFEYDRYLPGLWRYRDYVIQSFNSDKPYDQFLREQLAGDEMVEGEPTSERNKELLIAAGFHRLGAVRRNAGNQEVASSRNEVLTERTDIVGAAFLGLTVGCARCHDHKFDPIRHRDYYQLQAFLAATEERDVPLAGAMSPEEWRDKTKELRGKLKSMRGKMQLLEGEELRKMEEEYAKLEADLPPAPDNITTITNDYANRTPIHVLARGDFESKGERVDMRPLGVLLPEGAKATPADTENPRLILANWFTDPKHPLTSRVIVNRIWSFHFGKGIVNTPNDFGFMGDRPSHPELLDYLAAELEENGWRMKAIHKMILMSSSFRQASENPAFQEAGMAKDADNRLLWHAPMRRLSAEELRDAMLAVSGKLNTKMYGESVIIPVDQTLVDLLYDPTQWDVTKDHNDHYRRSVYLIAKRNLRLPFMEVFDQPAAQTTCARRESSTHAPQSLELLNGTISNDLAEHFAARIVSEVGSSPEQQVERAYLLAANRMPTDAEKRIGMSFLEKQPLREFALAMFNLNAFLYVQ
jgi:hypothetical protein